MDKKIIIGYSGHAYVVLDAAQKSGSQVIGYAEKQVRTQNPFQLNYVGFEGNKDFQGWNQGYTFILGIGDNKIREMVTNIIISKGENLASVIHPTATVGIHVEIDMGTFLASGVMINPLAKIGKSVIINTGSIIEHECKVDDFSHIAPGAVLAGNVSVGKRSFVGANAVIKEGVTIGHDAMIGAGAVVLQDVKSESKVVGNPGRDI